MLGAEASRSLHHPEKYEVEKDSYPTMTARVVAVMSSLAERGPSLEIVAQA